MNVSLKLVLASAVVVLGMASSAQAASLDVVRDSNGNPVKTTSGACLRSNWASDTDPCAPEPVAPVVTTESKAVYFAFGQSTLTKEGKKTLEALAADIKAKGAAVSAVRVAGYADRIGSATANEKLSKKRADTVRKQLVALGVANAQVVETRWFGDSVPATKCPSKLKKAKLIKCLQPDRRVEVEVDTIPGMAPAVAAEPVKVAPAAKEVKKGGKHHTKHHPAKKAE